MSLECCHGRAPRTGDATRTTCDRRAISPDGALLATASLDKTARLWEIPSGRPVGAPLRHNWDVEGVAFSPDGALLSTRSGHTVRLWDTVTGKPLGTQLRHDDIVWHMAFSPTGQHVATATRDGRAHVWEVVDRPTSLRKMELRTWVAGATRYDDRGLARPIPSQEWKALRDELSDLEAQR